MGTFEHRVRYAEVDQMHVAYHSRYLEWFEAARTELLRDWGLPYKRIEEMGVMLPVLDARCLYHRAIEYDDLIEIETVIQSLTKAKMTLGYALRKKGDSTICASGYTVHCFIRNKKPGRAPEELWDLLHAHYHPEE